MFYDRSLHSKMIFFRDFLLSFLWCAISKFQNFQTKNILAVNSFVWRVGWAPGFVHPIKSLENVTIDITTTHAANVITPPFFSSVIMKRKGRPLSSPEPVPGVEYAAGGIRGRVACTDGTVRATNEENRCNEVIMWQQCRQKGPPTLIGWLNTELLVEIVYWCSLCPISQEAPSVFHGRSCALLAHNSTTTGPLHWWYFMQLAELKSRVSSVLFELFALNMVMDMNRKAKEGRN